MLDCVSVKDMRLFDDNTIKKKISSIELMYNAANSVFNSYDFNNKKIYIIVGSGNNGGDGLALANIMIKNGILPYVYMITDKISSDSEYYYKQLKKIKFKNIKSIEECDYDSDVIVDCILGIGFKGDVKDNIKDIIIKINNSHSYVISVDIPSGLNGDNGIAKCAVKANKTIAIQFVKTGLVLNDAKDYTGELIVSNIGIDKMYDVFKIIEDYDVDCFKKRCFNTNKGSFGKCVVMGGSKNYVGAIKIANMGMSSLRVGAGLNVVAIPNCIYNAVAPHIVESTIFLMEDDGKHIVFLQEEIDKLLKDVTAVALGMGMGDNYNETIKIIDYIVHNYKINLLLDADALNALSGHLDILKDAKAKIVITPHPKELSRLTGDNIGEILNNPIEYAKKISKEYNIVVLLKGTTTIVANKDDVYIVTNGGPELAKGGSGDTLSGVITGLMAQKVDPTKSAYIGAYLCAKAAHMAKIEYSEYGVLASDVAKLISTII